MVSVVTNGPRRKAMVLSTEYSTTRQPRSSSIDRPPTSQPPAPSMSDIFSVTDQVVLVSGGTRGIGFAIAAGFAQRGANVVVTGRTPEGANAAAAKLAAGARLPPVGVACDVAQADQVRRLAAGTLERFG